MMENKFLTLYIQLFDKCSGNVDSYTYVNDVF